MHPQILEAQKRLDVAKDHYKSAIEAIEGQYVRPLVGQGIEAKAVAEIRASYGMTSSTYAEPPVSDENGPATARARTSLASRKKK